MTTKAIEAGARASLAALKEWDDLEGPLGVYDLGYHAKEVVVDPHAVRDFRPGENGRIVARFATHEEAMAEYELLTAKHYAKACIEAAIASGELVPASAMAAERERCAKVADRMAWSHSNTHMMGPEQNCVRVAEAIRALEPANGEFVLGWQDIETAPKDGRTWILIADDHCWPPDLVRWESERPARRTIDGYSKQKIPAGWFKSPGGRSRFDAPDGHLMKATRWHPAPPMLNAATSNGSGK